MGGGVVKEGRSSVSDIMLGVFFVSVYIYLYPCVMSKNVGSRVNSWESVESVMRIWHESSGS